MSLERAEAWARRAGAAGLLLFVALALVGLRRGFRHAAGRASGPAPLFLRLSFRFFLPLGVVALAVIRSLWKPLPLALPVSARTVALAVGVPLYFSGVGLMVWGRLALGEMYSISSSLGAQLYADHRLITSGPFALMRHPMYVGGIMAELGALLIYRTWATLIMALNVPSLVVRARREEDALGAEFGEQWAEYCRRVPAWMPRRVMSDE